jgi:hypothetical protein
VRKSARDKNKWRQERRRRKKKKNDDESKNTSREEKNSFGKLYLVASCTM